MMFGANVSFRNKPGAFTLIELLLVTSITASVGLAVFTALSNGLKLWHRSQKAVIEEDATLFLERFTSDLKNTFLFSRLSFSGTEMSMSFPTVVYVPADRKSARAYEGYVDQLGSVRYAFDPSRGEVTREEANYSLSLRGEYAPARRMVGGVKELHFKYFYHGDEGRSTTIDAQDLLPAAVLVEARFSDGNQEKVIKRHISIPLGT
jgi:Tfp pilus assembly protein PilE